MIYVDMDGVLANLYDYITLRLHNKPFKNCSEEEILLLRKVFREKNLFLKYFPEGAENVFENLEPFPFNEEIIKTILNFNKEYIILSRPCKLDLEGTKRAKRKWIEKYLKFNPPKEVLLVQDKSANNRPKNNILIDDWDEFLTRWKQKGGIPLKYQAIDFNTSEEACSYLFDNLQKVFN